MKLAVVCVFFALMACALAGRLADKCVPAPSEAGLCTNLPQLIGSQNKAKCHLMNDPRKGDVIGGLAERCINGIERDGPECLQAALDLACSFYCAGCESSDNTPGSMGTVHGVCTNTCEAVKQLCPISHGQLNCFKHYNMDEVCRAEDCSRLRPIRGDLANLDSGASTAVVSLFGVLSAVAVAVAVF
jgi:hypothetical protein